jgi:hypothetical protein
VIIEDSHLQAVDKDLRTKQHCQYIDFKLPATGIVKKT